MNVGEISRAAAVPETGMMAMHEQIALDSSRTISS